MQVCKYACATLQLTAMVVMPCAAQWAAWRLWNVSEGNVRQLQPVDTTGPSPRRAPCSRCRVLSGQFGGTPQ